MKILLVGSDKEAMQLLISKMDEKLNLEVSTATSDKFKDVKLNGYDLVLVDEESTKIFCSNPEQFSGKAGIVLGFDEAQSFHVEHNRRVGKGERKRNRKDRRK